MIPSVGYFHSPYRFAFSSSDTHPQALVLLQHYTRLWEFHSAGNILL